MRNEISTRHGHISAETREKITNKLGKLARFHDKLAGTHVIIDLKNEDQPDVEVTATVDGAPEFVAKTHGPHLMGAIDGAVQKIEQQLKRHKQKVIDNIRDSARRNQNVAAPVDTDEEI